MSYCFLKISQELAKKALLFHTTSLSLQVFSQRVRIRLSKKERQVSHQ